MEVPPVFTGEEITRFRGELASRRVPGAYEPGRWSLSPLDRSPDAVRSLPAAVVLRDSTLRSLETLPGVFASEADKADYLIELVRAGVGEVVTGGLRGRDDAALRAEVELVKREERSCRVVCPLVGSVDDIERAVRAGYDAVQVWVQGFGEMSLIYQRIYPQAWAGQEWRTGNTPRSRADVVARAVDLVRHAAGLGVDVVVPMLMVSYLTDDVLAESVTAFVAAGASEITLFDGPGALSPEAFALLVAKVRALAPDVRIGLHPHNTFGLAVGCAVAAVRAGADVVEVSVNGYCGGPGNADLAATALAFQALYGLDTGVRTERLTALARRGEALTGYHVAWNHPITGEFAFSWGGMDLISQEITVDPLLHNAVEPELVGNRRRIPFTLDSGGYTLAAKLDELGIVLTHAQADRLLARAQAELRERRRLLTDDELAALAEAVRETG